MKAFAAIHAIVFAIASNFASPAPAAAPKIEEKIVGPAFAPGVIYAVSPKGMHLATVHGRDGKTLVTVDGVDGPLIDSVYPGAAFGADVKVSQDGFNLRTKREWTGPVAFSPDGERHAYAGQIGKEAVVILDGKELFRGPVAQSGPAIENLHFSPDSKHLFFLSRTSDSSQSYRLVQNGQPVTPSFDGKQLPVFNADGSRWALAASKARAVHEKFLIVDGRDTGYPGEKPQFTPDGKRVVCLSGQRPKQSVLVDGKELVSGQFIEKVEISSRGDIAAVVILDVNGGRKLFINGKPVVDGAGQIVFSPDGNRWAAVCALNQKAWVVMNDGQKHKEYWPIEWLAFTPDSSKCVYVAGNGEQRFVVVNGKEDEGNRLIHYRPMYGQTGDGLAYTAGFMMGRLKVHYNDHVEPECLFIANLTLSPDGRRWLYYRKLADNTVSLMVNGVPTGPTAMQQGGPILFSPDSKHFAAPLLHAWWIDDRRVVSPATPMGWTPDSRHLIQRGQTRSSGGVMLQTWLVNGDLVAKFGARNVQWQGIGVPQPWEQQPDGTLVFVGYAPGPTGYGPMKRITVTPDPNRDITAWLADPKITDYTVEGAPTTAVAVTTTPPASSHPAPTALRGAVTPAPKSTVVASAPASVAAAPVHPLTWNDLVRRPETRPETCTVKRDYKFQNGTTVRTGAKVNIVEVKPSELVVEAAGGITFAVKHADTDALEVAQAAWAQLTPAQRDLTYPALMQRTDLWPYRVKLLLPFTLEGRKLRAGDTALLLKTEGNQLLVAVDNGALAFNVQSHETDLMVQARGFLAGGGAPSRVFEEFAGKLVSPLDGRRLTLDAGTRPKLVVMYMGAGWCGPCQVFAPQLVKTLAGKSTGPGEVTVLYLSGDKSPAEAKAYATKLGVDWPTIYFQNRGQLPAFAPLFGNTIPQLVVTDAGGKVLIDSARIGQERALAELKKLL